MVKSASDTDPDALKAFFQEELAKEPTAPPVQSGYEIVKMLAPEIEALLKRRRSRQEICDMLAIKGVKIGLGTFNTYYARAQRELKSERGETSSKPDRKSQTERAVKVSETTKAKPSELAGATASTPSEARKGLGHKLNDDDV